LEAHEVACGVQRGDGGILGSVQRRDASRSSARAERGRNQHRGEHAHGRRLRRRRGRAIDAALQQRGHVYCEKELRSSRNACTRGRGCVSARVCIGRGEAGSKGVRRTAAEEVADLGVRQGHRGAARLQESRGGGRRDGGAAAQKSAECGHNRAQSGLPDLGRGCRRRPQRRSWRQAQQRGSQAGGIIKSPCGERQRHRAAAKRRREDGWESIDAEVHGAGEKPRRRRRLGLKHCPVDDGDTGIEQRFTELADAAVDTGKQ
jgi:hypothetical protein